VQILRRHAHGEGPAQAGRIQDLETRLASSENQVELSRQAINQIQASGVLALGPYLTVLTLPTPTVQIRGANLQVVNGLASTQAVNGLGNLIIGYDELAGASPSCSAGFFVDQASCEAAGHTWAVSHKSGSHNLVLGAFNNYSQYAGVVTGERNTISAEYASVLGGNGNTASGFMAGFEAGSGDTGRRR